MLTNEQHEFLSTHLEDDPMRGAAYRIVFGSDNTRPLIRELVDIGVLAPWDVMRQMPSSGETLNLLGKTLPVTTLVGSYRLTPIGAKAMQASPPELPNPAPPKGDGR